MAKRKTTAAILIHHTAGNETSAAQLRGIFKARFGVGYIGYHAAISKKGEVWRDLDWGDVGIHNAAGRFNNTNSIGLSVVGNYENEEPSREALNTLKGLVGELKAKYGISSNDVVGHNVVKATACPGRNISNKMSEIREGGSDMDTVKLVTNIFERVWRRCNDLAPANMDSLRSEAEDVIRRFPKDDWAASGYIDRWFDGYGKPLHAQIKTLHARNKTLDAAWKKADGRADDALRKLDKAEKAVNELAQAFNSYRKECEDKLQKCKAPEGELGFWEYLGLAIRALFKVTHKNKRKED